MKTFITLALLGLGFSAESMACANFAKNAAIRAYFAEVGTVQGSEGIQYEATLLSSRNNIEAYLVAISDNNEDGEYWTVDYQVVLNAQNNCKVISVKTL